MDSGDPPGATEGPGRPPSDRPVSTGLLAAGAVFAGCTIEGVAGRGGMGVVYQAREARPARRVALKVISPDLAGDAGFRERFERESDLAATIEHSNVLPVYRAGEEGGLLYLVTRFVEGTDLAALLAAQGRLEPRRAVEIVAQVCEALDAAHARGLVHRDVKPANVLIATEGGRDHAFLADFGLTKRLDSNTGLTRTGSFFGTLDYAAPEQFEAGKVDARTDVYATGCVLYHVLTGHVPFPADSAAAGMFAHMSQAPPSLALGDGAQSAALDAVIAKAMAKAPDDRYLSAGDLGRAARAAVEGNVLTRAEHSVATGSAAEGEVVDAGAGAEGPAVVPPTVDAPIRAAAPPTVPPSLPPTRADAAGVTEAPPAAPAPPPAADAGGRGRRLLLIGVAVVVVGAVAGGVLALTGGGKSKHAPRENEVYTASDPCLLKTAEIAAAFGSPVSSPQRFQKSGSCRYLIPAHGLEVGIDVLRLNVEPGPYFASLRRGAESPQHPVVELPGVGDYAYYQAGLPIAGADVGTTHVLVMRGRLYMYVMLGLPLPVPAKGGDVALLTDPATQQKLVDLTNAALARAPRLETPGATNAPVTTTGQAGGDALHGALLASPIAASDLPPGYGLTPPALDTNHDYEWSSSDYVRTVSVILTSPRHAAPTNQYSSVWLNVFKTSAGAKSAFDHIVQQPFSTPAGFSDPVACSSARSQSESATCYASVGRLVVEVYVTTATAEGVAAPASIELLKPFVARARAVQSISP